MRSCLVCLDVNHCNNPSTEVDNVSRSISPPLLFISSQHIAKTGVTLEPLRDCMLMLATTFSIILYNTSFKQYKDIFGQENLSIESLCQSEQWFASSSVLKTSVLEAKGHCVTSG